MDTIKLMSPKKHYFDEGTGITTCPACAAALIEDNPSILLQVKSKNYDGQIITNISGSKFCANCPVVVFETKKLEKAAALGARGKVTQYAVIGIVDMNAESRQDNTIDSKDMQDTLDTPHLEPKQRIIGKKIGRNEKCPCGSGKKYKKCCLNQR